MTRTQRLHSSMENLTDIIHIAWHTNDVHFEAEGPANIVMEAFNDFTDYLACETAHKAIMLKEGADYAQSLPQ